MAKTKTLEDIIKDMGKLVKDLEKINIRGKDYIADPIIKTKKHGRI